MVEVLVWLLVSIPTDYRAGEVQVVERFKTQQQCEHVNKEISVRYVNTKCVQANVLVPR